jgi:hypothetical protein
MTPTSPTSSTASSTTWPQNTDHGTEIMDDILGEMTYPSRRYDLFEHDVYYNMMVERT